MIGSTIGRYKIEDTLGQGGMGVVYRAEDTQLKRSVALKFLAGDTLADPGSKARFLQEARAAAALDHPNICGVYQIDEDDAGRVFIAMPLVEGRSLERRIAEGPLPIAQAVEIARQIVDALEEAHQKDIVHRDLKPANIMVGERGRGRLQAVLMDFGLARLAGATRLTREGRQLGTAAYMSPEQVMGGTVDRRTDIWSLGTVLYEMTVGRTPFVAEYEQALFYGIQHEDPEPLTALRSGVPMELERIVFKCLAKAPEQRYQSATDLLVDLDNLAAEVEAGKSRVRPSSSGAGSSGSTVPGPPPTASTPSAASVRGSHASGSASSAETAGPAHETAATAAAGRAGGRAVRFPALAGATLVSAVLGAAAAWFFLDPAPAVPQARYQIRRVTWDGGLASFPALSPDGRLLAYSSDRGGARNLDIWVQQVDGGGLARITDDPADESHATFSPDGAQIAFTRTGVGLFTIPAIGGEPYLVASGAMVGDFSPDGKMLAYLVPGSDDGGAFYAPVSMGEPVRVFEDFRSFGAVVWAPDGKHLLCAGRNAEGVFDWWSSTLDGSEIRPLHAKQAFADGGFELPPADGWRRVGESLLVGGDGDLYRVRLARDGSSIDDPERLTFGAGLEVLPTGSADGRIAFMDARHRRDVWALPVDDDGEPSGALQRLTASEAADAAGRASADGSRLAWISDRWGARDIWVKTLPEGEESNITQDAADQRRPVFSPDGERVAYSVHDGDKVPVYARPISGGSGRTLCPDCGDPLGWSPNGDLLLYQRGPSVFTLNVADGSTALILGSEDVPVRQARLSPDGRWIAFRTAQESFGLRTAPFRGPEPIAPTEWIAVDDDPDAAFPVWSDDGRRLFYLSDRLGSTDVWTIAVDGDAKTPAGEPRLVRRFPNHRHSLSLMPEGDKGLDLSSGRLVFPISELRGDIWLLEPSPKASESP